MLICLEGNWEEGAALVLVLMKQHDSRKNLNLVEVVEVEEV